MTIVILAVLCIVALFIRVKETDYPKKTNTTLFLMPFIIVLTIVQAFIEKNPNVSTAWWLMGAIFVVLWVNTIISKREWDKAHPYVDETEEEFIEVEEYIENEEFPPAPPAPAAD